jgi:hypothetical protein
MGQLFKYQMSIEEGGSNGFGDEPGATRLGSIAGLDRGLILVPLTQIIVPILFSFLSQFLKP